MSARYDRLRSRVVITRYSGIELMFPAHLTKGLTEVSPDRLA